MHDATSRPKRMRHSYESRCRAVEAMLDGMSPTDAARSMDASRATGYRWLEEAEIAAARAQRRRSAHARRAAWDAQPRPCGMCCGA